MNEYIRSEARDVATGSEYDFMVVTIKKRFYDKYACSYHGDRLHILPTVIEHNS